MTNPIKHLSTLVIIVLLCGCAAMPLNQDVSSNDTVVELVTQAQQSQQQGHLRLAQDSYERALQIEPNNARIWLALAELAQLRGDLANMRGYAMRAQSLSDTHSHPWQQAQKLLQTP